MESKKRRVNAGAIQIPHRKDLTFYGGTCMEDVYRTEVISTVET
jgi:hypothetical protein